MHLRERLATWAWWNEVVWWVCVAIVIWFTLGTGLSWLVGYIWLDWMRQWVWPILLSAVVGYATNYVAVQMLFLPYRPTDRHWLRLITLGLWRQGVVPQRRSDLAVATANQVVEHLLPPQVVAAQLNKALSSLFEDPKFRENLRYFIGPIIRANVQGLADRLTPEVMSLLRGALRQGMKKENVIHFVETVLGPWLQTHETRQQFVNKLVQALQQRVPELVSYLRDAAERYAQGSILRKVFLWIAEFTRAIDWWGVQQSLAAELQSANTRRRLYDMVGDLIEQLSRLVQQTEFEPILNRMQQSTSDYLADAVEKFLQENLPDVVNRLLDAPGFWRWLIDEALPKAQPYISEWISRYGPEIAHRLNIRGQIENALNEMDVARMHQMANQVAGQELGAIQVLGFILGAFAGLGYSILLRLA
ncbi:MAG: DUF445 family protein [Gemmatales bacterium]|nr:DUF445 family protein [Gemmatales bacterium]